LTIYSHSFTNPANFAKIGPIEVLYWSEMEELLGSIVVHGTSKYFAVHFRSKFKLEVDGKPVEEFFRPGIDGRNTRTCKYAHVVGGVA